MALLIVEPASLELNKIWTNHNSHTDLATGPTAQRTTIISSINVIFVSAFVCMRARKLPSSNIGIKSPKPIKLFLAGKLQVLAHDLIKFSLNCFVVLHCPFASDPALDNLVLQNMAWRPNLFRV